MRKKRILQVTAASLFIMALYMLLYRREGLYLRITNAVSMAGVLDLMAALMCHVRNSGQFRILGYVGYRRYKRDIQKEKDAGRGEPDAQATDFHEYSQRKYAKKWDPIPFYIIGGVLVLASLVMIIFL